MSFVHLHVHSQYSLLRATPTIDALVNKCVEHTMPAVALTDYGNLFGALEFYFKCKEKGIQPILGLEAYLTNSYSEKTKRHTHEQGETVVLLVQNLEGYKNICHLSTMGYQEGFYYLPRIDTDSLKKYNKGLLALTGGSLGKTFQLYKNHGEEQALAEIHKLKNIFQDRLYLEYTKTNPELYNQFLKQASQETSLPLVATNDVHYIEQKDYVVQDVLVCIGENRVLEEREDASAIQDFDFKSPGQMKELFKEDLSAVSTTLDIAKRCQLEFQLKDKKGQPIYHLPEPSVENRKNLKSELKYLATSTLDKKLKELDLKEEDQTVYKERLSKELDIINSMGFTGYFLIVHEFVHWARKENIPVGPGRGSGASSLVAYCLGITDVDPIRYNLLFERFLNPERISMPDFDIDFCQEHRNRVIRHVHDVYGKDYVAQVITFGRLQAKAAIRDVGRVLAMSYSEVDAIAKLIPDRLGITIREAIEQNPTLKELKETDSQISTLLDLAMRIEGLVRHVSIHAAGVIIADQPILNYAPLYRSADNENVIQYDLKYAKKIGLVKFDFLGLKTLTHIRHTLDLIESNRGKQIKVGDISLNDPGIYKIMNKGDTLGIFQFEGFGITDLIKKAQPNCFEDIIAINALFRPGPMDMIPSYLERRKSKTARYVFPELEDILKETHGIVVYQEQVLLISALVAGYSYGEADVLRRAMGEKISSEMKQQKSRFLRGAKEKNFNLKKSEKLFDTVAEFAKYGFNKAHATAYCVLAAQTAWLKNYYPVEFFAALLTTEMGDTSKVTRYIKNAKEHQIAIQPPHVNDSEYEFSVRGDKMYFALGAIKGVGRSAVKSIIEVREQLEGKAFQSLDHFLESVDSKKVNKKVVESLEKAGALDGLGYNRGDILTNFGHLLERAEKKKRDRSIGQADLFSFSEEKEEVYLAQNKKRWSMLERLKFEKEVIGFYLSQHPLDYFKPYTRSLPSHSIAQIKAQAQEEVPKKTRSSELKSFKVWGIIDSLRETMTRSGSLMAFAQLEDSTGYLSLVIFSKTYLDIEKLLKVDEPVYLEVRKSSRDDRFVVETVQPFSMVLSNRRKIEIRVPQKMEEESLEQLKELMKSHEGKTTIVFKLDMKGSRYCMLSKQPAGLLLDVNLLEKMSSIVSSENIRLI